MITPIFEKKHKLTISILIWRVNNSFVPKSMTHCHSNPLIKEKYFKHFDFEGC